MIVGMAGAALGDDVTVVGVIVVIDVVVVVPEAKPA